jgi:hypothetical protein
MAAFTHLRRCARKKDARSKKLGRNTCGGSVAKIHF